MLVWNVKFNLEMLLFNLLFSSYYLCVFKCCYPLWLSWGLKQRPSRLCQQRGLDWMWLCWFAASVWMAGNSPLTEEIPQVPRLLEHLGHSLEPQEMWLGADFPWEACWVCLNALHECRRCRVVSPCLLALQSSCQGCQVWLPGVPGLIARAPLSSPGTAGVSSPAPCTWLSCDITQQDRQKMSERLQLLQK